MSRHDDSTRISKSGEGDRAFLTLDGKPAKSEASGLYVIVTAPGVPDCRVPYSHFNAAIG